MQAMLLPVLSQLSEKVPIFLRILLYLHVVDAYLGSLGGAPREGAGRRPGGRHRYPGMLLL